MKSCSKYLGAVVLVAVTCLPATLYAQQCHSEALDALARARRARSFQLDFSNYRTVLDARFDRLYRWLDEGDQHARWSTQFTWLGDNYKFSDYTLCTSEGAKSAQLGGGWDGFALETRNQDWKSLVRLMIFDTGDSVAPDELPRDANGQITFDGNSTGYGKFFYGAYVQITDWFGATVGAVAETKRNQHIGTTTTGNGIHSSTTINTRVVGTPEWYLSASIPRWGLSTDLVFAALDQVDVGLLRAAAIPIPGVDHIQALAGGGYLAYEDTGIGYLGARYTPWSFLKTSLELGFEPVRVRSAVARAEVSWQAPGYFKWTSTPGYDFHFMIGAEAKAFVEASLYNSAYLERQTGRTDVPGILAGASLGLITRPVGVNIALYGGENAANYIARIADVVGKPLFGTRLTIRAGW